METGGATNFGSVTILELDLNVGQLVNLAELFVPTVRNSSVHGFTAGMTVAATETPAPGDDKDYAFGFVGVVYGAQIQLNNGDTSVEAGLLGTSSYDV